MEIRKKAEKKKKCQVRAAPCIRKQRISLFLLQAGVGVKRKIATLNIFKKTSHFARSGKNCLKILNIFVFHIVSHTNFAY